MNNEDMRQAAEDRLLDAQRTSRCIKCGVRYPKTEAHACQPAPPVQVAEARAPIAVRFLEEYTRLARLHNWTPELNASIVEAVLRNLQPAEGCLPTCHECGAQMVGLCPACRATTGCS